MFWRSTHLCRLSAVGASAIGLSIGFTAEASAHVKWFCAYNIAGQPRGLENVLCPDFELLMGWALLMLLCGYFIESTSFGAALLRSLNRATAGLQSNTPLIVRASCGFFFVAAWTTGGLILTPELKTSLQAVAWLQLAIAAGLLWRKTLPLSALGIAALYLLAVHDYGIFHLLDYPIFLGIAVYLALIGLQRDFFGIRPMDILRWSAAVTLMWASIEKWAYPEWSYPLFVSHPGLTMGFSSDFFMRAAGMVEFTLSFALILTPLMRRLAAAVLCGMFLAAIPEFGKIDAMGHAPIVAVMLAIIGDDMAAHRWLRVPSILKADVTASREALTKWGFLLFPAGYGIALAGFLMFYYVLHAGLFGTTLT